MLGPGDLKQKMEDKGLDPSSAAKLAPMVANIAKLAFPGLVVGATIGVGAMLAEMGAAKMREGSRLFYGLGSDPKTAGIAGALGRASGVDAVSKARSLGEALMQGSYGSAYLRSKGINDAGSLTVDKGTNYVRAIDELRRIKSDREAIRVARDVGLEDELWMRDLSNNSYRRLRDSGSRAGSPDERRSEAEYRASKEEFGSNWDRLWRGASQPIVDLGTAFVRGVNNTFDSGYWSKFGSKEWVEKYGGYDMGVSSAAEKARSKNNEDPYIKALNENTRAITENTRVGGGKFASGAIPEGFSAGWKRGNLSETLKSQATLLGGFSIN
ncbi:hypothetical protein EON81_05365 [bacterium]|nr:MAG: hypothetical protein EON81_05365 [bacterium]